MHIFVLNSSDHYRLRLKSQYILPSCSSAGSGSVSAFIRAALAVAVSGKRCALHHNGQVQMSALPQVRPVCVYSLSPPCVASSPPMFNHHHRHHHLRDQRWWPKLLPLPPLTWTTQVRLLSASTICTLCGLPGRCRRCCRRGWRASLKFQKQPFAASWLFIFRLGLARLVYFLSSRLCNAWRCRCDAWFRAHLW